MLTLNDRSIFIDSTDSDARDSSEQLNVELTSPITTELEMNRLYIGLRSFTFTNLVYNIQAQDYLTFVPVYTYPNKQPFFTMTQVYLAEGQYTGQQVSDQWSLQQVTPGDPLSTTVIDTKNYTVLDAQNMEILPSLNFNARTLKFSFEWGTDDVTSYKIPTAELESDAYPYAPYPTQMVIPINSNTTYMALRLGLYKDTDTLYESQYTGNSAIIVPLIWSVSLTDGGTNTLFQLQPTKYIFNHTFREQSIQFIDIECSQIAGFHYASKANNVYPEGILCRIPILAGFNQTQSSYYDELTWCPISQKDISNFQFTLSNPYTSAALFRSPLQFEIVVHEEKVSIDELTTTTSEQQRFMLPLTRSGDRTTDNLDVTHSRQTPHQSTLGQTSYMGTQPGQRLNKRSRYAPGF